MFLWLYFSSHSLLLLSHFLLIFYNSDHEENESELDERKLQREETVERGWRWCFLCLVLLLILNQIDRRNRREESIKLTEKRTKSWQREKDNKESVEFYGMINGRKLCGLLLSVLKSLMWLIILLLTKWMYLMRTFLILPSNP